MNQKTLDIYNDLIKKYHNLSIEEQRAILIYKSQLYHFMDAIISVTNFENLEAEEIASKIPHLDKYLVSIARGK